MFQRCISSFLVILLWAGTSWAAVTYDTDTTSQNAGTDTTDSFTHTIGAGSNVYVGVCVTTRGGGAVTGVQINGGAATWRATGDTTASGSDVKVEYWDRVLGSTTGGVTIAPTITSNDAFRTTAFSLFGVDQTTPVGTAQSTQGASTSLSVNVSSAAGEVVVSCLAVGTSGTSSLTVGAGQTEQWVNTVDNNNTFEQGSTEPGGATVTMSHSWTGGNYSGLVAVPVKAAASATAQQLMLMGVGN